MLREAIQSTEHQIDKVQGNQRAVSDSWKNQIHDFLLIISYNEKLSVDKAAISPYDKIFLKTGENIFFFIVVLFVRNFL